MRRRRLANDPQRRRRWSFGSESKLCHDQTTVYASPAIEGLPGYAPGEWVGHEAVSDSTETQSPADLVAGATRRASRGRYVPSDS